VTTLGVFLSLDGPDGTGKTTQCQLLVPWLRQLGWTVTCCADPGGTLPGEQIRRWLLQESRSLSVACEAFLFLASRAQLVAEVIRPALDAGHVVLTDRFTLATLVYQGHAGGLARAPLEAAAQLATGGLEPDLILVLDLPVELAQARRGRPADRLETRYDPQRVREGFLLEAQRQPERIRLVDARPPIPLVQEELRQQIRTWLERTGRRPPT
jgi:dTMP kinase